MTKAEMFEILRQGPDVWNEWRKNHKDTPVDFSDLDISGMALPFVDLSNSVLKNIKAVSTDLSHSDLQGADLSDAYFGKANLSEANLSNTVLEGTLFRKSKIIGTVFRNAIFINVRITGNPYNQEPPRLSKSDFSGAALNNLDFNGADLKEAIFHNTSLCGADFSHTELQNADFNGADLRGAILLKADLEGTKFSNAILHELDFKSAKLTNTDFSYSKLLRADLSNMNLTGLNFSFADLSGANLNGSVLSRAVFTGATLREANFSNTDLAYANFVKADMAGADLTYSRLIETNFKEASISYCNIYGISSWGAELEGARQTNLIITRPDEPKVTVDDLEVVQFMYLMITHKKLRNVINSVTQKGVLILGRFVDGGITFLEQIASALRDLHYLPIIIDFDRPSNRDHTEVVKTLVGLSRFVIVDLSGPSVPQELYAAVPHFKIPFAPIIEKGKKSYSMFIDILAYPWVLPPVEYADSNELLSLMPAKIIEPAEQKLSERQSLLNQLFTSS